MEEYVMSDKFNELKQLIANHSDIAEFADFGDGVSAEWIEKAESALGFSLPPSYKWWLTNYGGGEIGGEEIFSIYEEDFNCVVGGDIVYMYRLNQDNGQFNTNQVVVCESDIDGAFYFNRAMTAKDNEFPIFSSVTEEKYADDFLEFLKKRIEAFSK